MRKAERRPGVEALRGFAASAVILLHSTAILPLQLPGFGAKLIGFLVLGVPLFFVISAFSLAFGYAGRLDQPGSVLTYTIRRFFRIAPLFYFMIVAWGFYLSSLGSPMHPLIDYVLNITFTFGAVPGYHVSIVPAG